MKMFRKFGFIVVVIALTICDVTLAQDDEVSDADELKITALEALISAPPERALPLVTKVLQGNHSDEVKESALFILSQIETPEAQALLLDTARQSSGDLQIEAIQMAGIGGDPDTLAALRDIYTNGDSDVREAVVEAYLIAGDSQAIYEIAVAAESEDDFESAVEMLAAMGAMDELRSLLDSRGPSEGLVEAYIIADDFETLNTMAMDGSNPEVQIQAIEGLGIVGDEQANTVLLEIYRGADNADVKEAAMDGMLIADYDEGLLALYRESQDTAEKRELLEYLTMMDSDEVWALIDEALEEQQ
jgi:HEAT repeat protein